MLAMFSARKIRRDILGITQAELARSLGVDQAAVSRMETAEANGIEPDRKTQLALKALAMEFPNGMKSSASEAA